MVGKGRKMPPLPKRPSRSPQWTPEAREAWGRIWKSPMASEFVDADWDRLVLYLEAVDGFYRCDSDTLRLKYAVEIRHQGAEFGLTPLSRRRLQWEVERSEDAQARGRRRAPKPPATGEDARLALAK